MSASADSEVCISAAVIAARPRARVGVHLEGDCRAAVGGAREVDPCCVHVLFVERALRSTRLREH